MKAATLLCLFGPAAASAQKLAAEPAALTLEDGASATLRLTPPVGAPRFFATVGRVEGDRFLPGDRRDPGFALIVEETSRAAVVIPLSGSGALPTNTAPGASVTVEVEGQAFGPVTADGKGNAQVPVVVPPTVREVTVSSVDQFGRRTVRRIGLPPLAFPRAIVLAPARLREGEAGTATVVAIEPNGRWRTATPVVETDAALQAGRPRALGPGQWQIPFTAAGAAAGASLRIVLDGEAVAVHMVEVIGRPVVVPIEPQPEEPTAISVYAGGASAFGPVASILTGAEYARPLRRRGVRVSLFAAVAGAFGAVDEFRGTAIDGRLVQVHFDLGTRIRFVLSPRLAFEATAGAGVAWGRSSLDSGIVQTSVAPLFFGGGALDVVAGDGEIVIEARWTELRFDETTRVEGNALGATLLVGYRFHP